MILILALAAATAVPAVQGTNPVSVGQSMVEWGNVSNSRAYPREVGEPGRLSARPQQTVDISTCRSSMTKSRLESIYRGRVTLQGRAKADAWLRDECGAAAEAVAASAAEEPSATPTENAEKPDGKGCRMVMRPIPNVGGGAMTMGMVPDCD